MFLVFFILFMNKVSCNRYGPEGKVSQEKRCDYNKEIVHNPWWSFKDSKTCETCHDGSYYNTVAYPHPIPQHFLSGSGDIKCAACPDYTLPISDQIYKTAYSLKDIGLKYRQRCTSDCYSMLLYIFQTLDKKGDDWLNQRWVTAYGGYVKDIFHDTLGNVDEIEKHFRDNLYCTDNGNPLPDLSNCFNPFMCHLAVVNKKVKPMVNQICTKCENGKSLVQTPVTNYYAADFPFRFDCVSCPAGTVSIDFETFRLTFPEESEWLWCDDRCVICPSGTFNDKTGQNGFAACQDKCPLPHQYIELQRGVLSGRRSTTTTALRPVRCVYCPAGFQLASQYNAIGSVTCSAEEYFDCCEPCGPGTYKSTSEGICQAINDKLQTWRTIEKTTITPYAAHELKTCSENHAVYLCLNERNRVSQNAFCCSASNILCSVTEQTLQFYSSNFETAWPTCLPCQDIERPLPLPDAGCEKCILQKPAHEYWDAKEQKCSSCNSCKFFTFFEVTTKVQIPEYSWLSEYNDNQNLMNELTAEYEYNHINAYQCQDLERRKLRWYEGKVDINPVHYYDYYKSPKINPQIQLYEQLIVPPFKTFHRCIDSSCDMFDASKESEIIDGQCKLKDCSEICEKQNFMYSQGCGFQDNFDNIWLENKNGEFEEHIKWSDLQAKLDMSTQPENDLTQYEIIHHGKCVECQLCTSGQFNENCNKYGPNIDPFGSCKDCKSTCNPGYYLYHANGYKGCHPSDEFLAQRVTSDYECKRCSTWLLEEGKLLVVAGCGFISDSSTDGSQTFQRDFTHFDLTGGILQQITKQIEHDANIIYQRSVKTFPYCPVDYYFDNSKRGCEFVRNDPDGTDLYNVNCCVLCRTCGELLKKGPHWSQCLGTDVGNDPQDDCQPSCPRGTYETNITSSDSSEPIQNVCQPCSDCREGEVL